jgi:hypothetical protein
LKHQSPDDFIAGCPAISKIVSLPIYSAGFPLILPHPLLLYDLWILQIYTYKWNFEIYGDQYINRASSVSATLPYLESSKN